MPQDLSPSSSFVKRLNAWIIERFPPATWIVFIIMYISCSLCGQAIAAQLGLSSSTQLVIGLREIFGGLASIAFFMLLRILDEHKDYDKDCIHHPERVLQRGLVQLRHLRVLGFLCVIITLAFCIYCDRGFGPVSLAFLVVLVWISLMTKEFFCGEWLTEHLVLYAVSHMLVMPLVTLWFVISAMGTVELSPALLWLAAGIFFGGFAFELTRKTKGPEEEIVGVDTYSSLLGRRRSSVFAVLAVTAELLTKYFVIRSLYEPDQVPLGYGATFIGLELLVVLCFAAYLKNPGAMGRKRNEGAVGLSSLVSYIALLTAIILRYGLTFVF